MRRAALVAIAALVLGLPHPAAAGPEIVTYETTGSFDDAVFGLESAIVDRGLVIDYVSHVGEMLERTGADVGSDMKIFENAQVFLFCSAQISRKVMEADPTNLGHCPYGVFVAEREGAVSIGHRTYPGGPMQEVEALLAEIARDAAAF